jgi:hypothetical protein
MDPLDEGHVDLEDVHGQTAEVLERVVPGAEVVERDAHAETVDALELFFGPCASGRQGRLRELEEEAVGGQA